MKIEGRKLGKVKYRTMDQCKKRKVVEVRAAKRREVLVAWVIKRSRKHNSKVMETEERK